MIVETLQAAIDFADKNEYPFMIRPSFTLKGDGSGIARDLESFIEIVTKGLALSPLNEVDIRIC